MELWGAEYQENNAILVTPERLPEVFIIDILTYTGNMYFLIGFGDWTA